MPKESGLAHILNKHKSHFEDQGISTEEIPQYIMTAIKYSKIVDIQDADRIVYQFTYKGKSEESLLRLELMAT